MLGKKVRVFWPVDESWYTGTVKEYDASSGEHLLCYSDGDTEWVKIGENTPGAVAVGTGKSGASGEVAKEDATDTAAPEVKADAAAASVVQPPAGSPDRQKTVDGMMRTDMMGGGQGFPGGQFPMSFNPMPSMGPYGPYAQFPGMYPPQFGGPPPPSPSRMKQATEESGMQGEEGAAGARKKAGPKAWSKEEDGLLLKLVQNMRMPMKWSVVAQSLPDRTGKQCRERYVNHLNPRLKTSDWNPVEDTTIFHLYGSMGSHWAKMSKVIPGRTDNGIKNRFHNLRRQYEREDDSRMRLSGVVDFPDDIRFDRLRKFPEQLKNKSTAELWDIHSGIGVLAAQSILGTIGNSRTSNYFGPFREADDDELCVRCGLCVPSVQTGKQVCSKTGWCQSCARIPPHVADNLLRECVNLRRAEEKDKREIIESWEEYFLKEEEDSEEAQATDAPAEAKETRASKKSKQSQKKKAAKA